MQFALKSGVRLYGGVMNDAWMVLPSLGVYPAAPPAFVGAVVATAATATIATECFTTDARGSSNIIFLSPNTSAFFRFCL